MFAPLDSSEQVDQLAARSFSQPVIIFKHSPTCGTSVYAFDELQAYGDTADALAIHLIDVRRNRSLSREVARRFGVHHESPQLLLLVNGGVRWHTSHYGVTAAALQRALGAAA